jgi:phospholipase D-like protein
MPGGASTIAARWVYAGLALREKGPRARDGGCCERMVGGALEGRLVVKIGSVDPLLIAALAPLVLIDLAMIVYCIIDLYKPERRVRGGNKLVWLLVILLVSTLGWIVYLLAGREE